MTFLWLVLEWRIIKAYTRASYQNRVPNFYNIIFADNTRSVSIHKIYYSTTRAIYLPLCVIENGTSNRCVVDSFHCGEINVHIQLPFHVLTQAISICSAKTHKNVLFSVSLSSRKKILRNIW